MISAELPSVNPMPAAAQPEYEVQHRDHDRHVGAADRDDQERAEHQRNDAPVFDGVDLLPKLRDELPSVAISTG
jgi:hypothetical protein